MNDKNLRCLWGNCKRKVDNVMFCKEHYLLKEARYALYDLKTPHDEWNGGQNSEHQFFKDAGVKRLINLAEYYLEEK